jgi:hypothetical protein
MVDGKKDDAFIHEPILDNPDARKELASANIRLAIELGVDPETAREIYGA